MANRGTESFLLEDMDSVEWLAFLGQIADRSDQIAMRFFRSTELAVTKKADQSPVTAADKAIEEMARLVVRQQCPNLGVYGEETGETPASGASRLIIDPIDGTRNFTRGIPIFATLLAIEADGEIVAGIVSAPALGSRWRAAKDHGAWRGNRRIRVSKITDLAQAQLFHGDLGGLAEPPPPSGIKDLVGCVERSRGFGDFYQHVLVAEGAGEISVDMGLSAWDIAALQIVVEEAGGKATNIEGRRSIHCGSLICSNGLLHDKALQFLGRRRRN